ncbi:MAG: hypothetical protein ACI93T_003472 [Porticoccaceae bacterium]
MRALILWRRRALRLLLVLAILYVPSYFVLGHYQTGRSFEESGRTLKQFTYHDRGFPFDPWVYKPIAKVEYWMRGKGSQVVIEGSFRGGQPTYGYGPFE